MLVYYTVGRLIGNQIPEIAIYSDQWIFYLIASTTIFSLFVVLLIIFTSGLTTTYKMAKQGFNEIIISISILLTFISGASLGWLTLVALHQSGMIYN